MKFLYIKKAAVIFTAACMAASFSISVYAEETTDESDENTFTDEVLTYKKVDGGVYITDCDDNVSSVNISKEVDGYAVIGVETNAFAECEKLKEVILPDSVKYMGESVFTGCTGLKKVKIPDGITEIPKQTFALCVELEEIEIPQSVTTIGEYAFSYCNDLSWFDIPETITDISDYAFAYSVMGETLELPEGLESLGSLSFYYSQGLKTVTLPSTLNSVGSLAFLGCADLTEYKVADGNTTYTAKNGILYTADMTNLVSYPAGKTDEVFNLPETVQYISDGAFFANTYVSEINLTDSLISLGTAAFSNCTSLKYMEIPAGVTELPDSLFCDCTSLREVVIPDTVTTIGPYAFLECTLLTNVTISDNVTEIGDHAFGFTDDDEGNFHKIDGFTIKANFDSQAKKYAKENKISIEYLDGNKDMPYIIALIGVGAVAAAVIVVLIILRMKKRKKEKDYYKK